MVTGGQDRRNIRRNAIGPFTAKANFTYRSIGTGEMALGVIKVDRSCPQGPSSGLGLQNPLRLDDRPWRPGGGTGAVRLHPNPVARHVVGGHDVDDLVAEVVVLGERSADVEFVVIGVGPDGHYFSLVHEEAVRKMEVMVS